jgi:hypothetical protein
MVNMPTPVSSEQLRWRCDQEQFGFQTTAEVRPLDGLFGQERGAAAIELALGLAAEALNLYVAGPPGTGRETAVREQVARVALPRPTGVTCTISRTRLGRSPLNCPPGRGRPWCATWTSSWRPAAGRSPASSSESSTSSGARRSCKGSSGSASNAS